MFSIHCNSRIKSRGNKKTKSNLFKENLTEKE